MGFSDKLFEPGLRKFLEGHLRNLPGTVLEMLPRVVLSHLKWILEKKIFALTSNCISKIFRLFWTALETFFGQLLELFSRIDIMGKVHYSKWFPMTNLLNPDLETFLDNFFLTFFAPS